MNSEVTSALSLWQRFRMNRFLVLCWLTLVLSFALLWGLGNSIIVPWYQRWGAGLFVGVIMGSFRLVVLSLPWAVVSYHCLRGLKIQRVGLAWLVMGVPVLFFCIEDLRLATKITLPHHQPTRFAQITGKVWPQDARLLTRRHSFLAADHQHIWFFESDPEVFQSFVQTSGWSAVTEEDVQWGFLNSRFPWHARPTRFPSSWQPTEFWYWEADKDAQTGPFGPAYLLTDSNHTHWCLWNDGI